MAGDVMLRFHAMPLNAEKCLYYSYVVFWGALLLMHIADIWNFIKLLANLDYRYFFLSCTFVGVRTGL